MEYERKGISIIWRIENAEYILKHNMELQSPIISVDSMDGTKWRIGVLRNFASDLCLTIKREAEDNGPEEFGLHYEFLAHIRGGTSSTLRRTSTFIFQKNQISPKFVVNFSTIENFFNPNILTLECKMWKQRGFIPKFGIFYAVTRMRAECCVFIGKVKQFSAFSLNDRKTLKIVSSFEGKELMSVSILLKKYKSDILSGIKSRRELLIEVLPIGDQPELYFLFKLFLLDSLGEKRSLGVKDHYFNLKSSVDVPLHGITKRLLIDHEDNLVPNDTLSLHFEIKFCTGKEYDEIKRIVYEPDSSETVKTDFPKEVELLTSKEGIPCDIKIHTATETFSAHADILTSQSPVFEAMFRSNMKEAMQKCIHIDDIDAITVKRMLVFLYSGTIRILHWRAARKLYSVADKYQILSLKSRCTVYLKINVDLSNCIVLLLLADKHHDKDLKKAIQNFIADNGQVVLLSDEWKDFENNHPELTIEILRNLCLETIVL